MAAYGALVSLMNTINIIQHHPHPPISLEQHQTEPLIEMVNFFKEFLRTYNPHASYTEEADPLDTRIAAAAYAAEDAIDRSIRNHSFEVAGLALHVVPLQRVLYEMGSIKKKALGIKRREGVQHHQIMQLQTKSSTSSASSAIQHNFTTMVGVEEVTNELLDKLIGGNPSRQIIPITGMGGIGKTTLATNVYQHNIVVQHFDICAWATISQDFRMKEILLKLHQNKLNEMNEDDLGVKLHQHLSSRRYLIVLDDVWDIEVWNKLQLYLPNNNNGSRVVLTTRLSKLAHKVCGYGYPSLGIEMRFLDKDTSWGLFCKVVFGRDDFPLELEKMETIGRKIVASCKGLPLSINIIGGLLKVSAITLQYWEYVVENLNSIVNSEDNEHCLKILYTSYNSLPVYLKPCLMYMGVFEEDSLIRVSLLIRLWVAEGFVEAESGKTLEEVAQEWLTELVDRNLIIVEKLDYLGKLEYCKIHDLLRDFSLREARKHKFLHIKYLKEELYFRSSFLVSIGPLFRKRSWRVYSIDLLYKKYDPDFVYPRVNIRLVEAMSPNLDDSFFSSISSCWNLQTLRVIGSFSLPFERIWNMSQLRHVEIRPSLVLLDPLDDDFVLKNLQTLSTVENMKFGDGVIKRLPNIKELKVEYRVVEQGVHDHCLNNVCHLQKLSSLSLVVKKRNDSFSETQNLTFPQSLKELRLSGTKLPWKDMTEKLGSLPQLQVLRLSDDACIGCEWHTAEGQFCSLKILEIKDCDLENWETESSHFPRLEHLLLTGLRELKEVPSSIGEIPTLQSITLKICSDSAQDSAIKIREEQEDEGNYDLQLRLLQ